MPGRTRRRAGLGILLWLALAAPVSAGGDGNTAASDFETSLVLKDAAGMESVEFQGRGLITFTVTIRNRSDALRTLTLPSGQTHDCIVYSETDQEVWRWSAGRVFIQTLTELTLAPGESQSFTATWDLTDRQGAPLPPGEYRAVGLVPGRAPGLRSGPLIFTIRR